MKPKYKRVLLKLSGESLAGNEKHGIDFDTVLKFCEPVKKLVDMGVEVAIVVGGGNFWRGRSSGQMDRTRADHMGMLATVINALGVADALEQFDLQVRVQTAISMQQVAEPYIRNRAVRHLEKGRVVVFGCGTGNPFFSTDTAAALRAAEIEADIILKATLKRILMQRNLRRLLSKKCLTKILVLWIVQPQQSARTTIFQLSYSALIILKISCLLFAAKI